MGRIYLKSGSINLLSYTNTLSLSLCMLRALTTWNGLLSNITSFGNHVVICSNRLVISQVRDD